MGRVVIGVIADDLTGAADVGSMFAEAGQLTHVYPNAGEMELWVSRGQAPDVAVIDTNSRFDQPAVAASKVAAAAGLLGKAGCERWYKKLCSVFRGNVGAELDALLDSLQEDFAVVVAGFPKNGRTTVDGIHYVHGTRLEDSEFRDDPTHPMDKSDVVEILQAQTRRPVRLISHNQVAHGSARLEALIAEGRSEGGYAVVDVVDQQALATIAKALREARVVAGSSGIVEELAPLWAGRATVARNCDLPPRAETGVVCVAGSVTPRTRAQIRYLVERGTHGFELDTLRLFDLPERSAEIARLIETVVPVVRNGLDAVVHSANSPALIEATREAGGRHGLAAIDVSRLVSDVLAEVVTAVVEQTGTNRLVIAGGDTAEALCRRLGIHALRIWQTLAPGVPSCLSLAEPRRLLALKPGGYGDAEFFAQAIRRLRQE